MATWAKLKTGDWGIKVPTIDAKEGNRVTVKKKSGEEKAVTIEKVLWSGDGFSLCTVHSAGGKKRRRSSGDWPGKMCPACESEPLDNDLSCWECGYRGQD